MCTFKPFIVVILLYITTGDAIINNGIIRVEKMMVSSKMLSYYYAIQ